ncbi:MAG: HEAT repeat domain-containing protein [Cytophagia bacterium]|nr:HEAT repeat domain-containing protein [Cytophagia bacterium]
MRFLNKIFGHTKTTDKPTEPYPKLVNAYKPDFDSIHDFGQISSIFEWVYNPDFEVAKNCAQTIHRLLTKQTIIKNNTFYNSLKSINIKKGDIRKFDRFDGQLKLSLLNVASMNSSGYVREEALNELLTNSNQFTFPFILLRLGDWVAVIKLKAERAIKEVIQREEPDFLIRNYRLIEWLLKVERSDLRHIHQYITEFIFSDSNIENIIRSFDKYSDGARFFILRNLIQKAKLQGSALQEILSDKNYLIRFLAAKNIEFINNPELTKRLLKDRSEKIRQYAVNKIEQGQINEFKAEIHQLLFDSSAGIRAAARLSLNKIEKNDFLRIYKEHIITKPNVGCIVGLAEVGTKNEIDIIERFLTSTSVKLRTGSLYAISILDYSQAKKIAFGLLNDDSNTVKKRCCTIIEKEMSIIDIEKLRAIYDSGQNETKRFVLKTISKYGGWSIAGDFLKGILESDEKVRATSCALFSVWYKYSIRLGTTQRMEDKQYVMNIYSTGHFNNIKLPSDIDRVVKEIPFVFGTDKK